LIQGWSGGVVLPEYLILQIEREKEFFVSSCISKITIPCVSSIEKIIENFELLMNYGSSGFGSV